MQPVRDETGTQYLLLERGADVSLVCDPATGAREELPTGQLEPLDEPPLETLASGLSTPLLTLITAVHDEQSLGVLVALADRGGLAVRTLLAETTLCESDLHGLLAELVAAGLLAETTVAGEHGYEATETAREAIAQLRA
jgi:hypothetical protein